jgi:cellulose synthase/poly-beta-1,6-N-acetylglucosamine synthase-like glycosyltransferase
VTERAPPVELPASPRPGAGRWGTRASSLNVVVRVLVVVAAIVAVSPFVALARGIVEAWRLGLTFGVVLALVALLLGSFFFLYSIKYYLSTIVVLLSALVLGDGNGNRNGNGNGHTNGNGHPHGLMRFVRRRNGNGHGAGNGNGNGHLDLGYEPFVSIHVATYNEKRVISRLLEGCAALDYKNFEVVVVDDSTDETTEILNAWTSRRGFKIVHRPNRDGFKGGALQVALEHTDPKAEFVVVWDADVVPFPDSIQTFLPYFFKANGNGANGGARADHAKQPPEPRPEVAAVQSYQWHVLNKSESWLTEAVRAEYAGSYMVERPFQEFVGSLKMVAGTAYMIRAGLLRELGWGRSLTEDWELTLRLYACGYKVVYTPYAESPAECVATFGRLARQRMRWAEGHSYNVRRHFGEILGSKHLGIIEKVDFLFYATYYLQAAFFIVGTAGWLTAEIFLHAHVPGWTALLGWSLLLTNLLSLPAMNVGGLLLEEAPAKDFFGVLGALATSYLLVPFQAYAAIKGFIERDEGPWYRTPKTGRITDPVHHLHRLSWLRRWLFGPGRGRPKAPQAVQATSTPPRPRRSSRLAWVVIGALVLACAGVGVSAMRAPVAQATSGTTFYLHGFVTPTVFSVGFPFNLVTTVTFDAPCVPACPVTWTGGAFGAATATTGDQTIFAGTYTFDYWTTVGTNAVISWTFEYGNNIGCTISPVVIATNPAFTLIAGHTGGIPVAVATGSNTLVTAGHFLCLTMNRVSGGPAVLEYDNFFTATSFQSPAVIFIPEYGVALVGLALVAPWLPRVRRRRPG